MRGAPLVPEAQQRQQLQTRMSTRAVAVRGPAASAAQIILRRLASGQAQDADGVLLGVARANVRHWFGRLAIPAIVRPGEG